MKIDVLKHFAFLTPIGLIPHTILTRSNNSTKKVSRKLLKPFILLVARERFELSASGL